MLIAVLMVSINIVNCFFLPVRISIKENIDSIRLQKQLSEKNVALAVLQEKFNNLNEVPFSFLEFHDLTNAVRACYSLCCYLFILSCQMYENQLEEVNVLLFRMSDKDMTNRFV